jgi:hypothetical protein
MQDFAAEQFRLALIGANGWARAANSVRLEEDREVCRKIAAQYLSDAVGWASR